MQVASPTNKQSHIDSIHSPQIVRNTTMKEWKTSTNDQRGTSLSSKRYLLSGRENYVINQWSNGDLKMAKDWFCALTDVCWSVIFSAKYNKHKNHQEKNNDVIQNDRCQITHSS